MNETELLEKIRQWNDVKHQLDDLAKIEYELREACAKEILADKVEGSKTLSLLGTLKVQATAIINYRIDRAELDLIKDEMSEAEWASLNFRPEIRAAKFRQVPNEAPLRNCVSTSQGKYQFKIVEDLA